MSRANLRAYLPPESWAEGAIYLTGREAHHLRDVLRLRSGAELICFDGRGREAAARVRSLDRKGVALEVAAARIVPAPPCEVTLVAAVPANAKLEQLVDQAAQMGVAAFIPLQTARTVVRLKADQRARKLERLRQVAIEAAKQCGIPRLPRIDPITPWKELLGRFSEPDLVLLCLVEGAAGWIPQALPQPLPKRVWLLIGPEGDWSPEEIREAQAQGARTVSLGPTTLRCETAAVAALAQLHLALQSAQS